jgi:hypothetical protein
VKFEPLFQMPTAWTSVSGRFGVHLFEGRVTLEDMQRMKTLGDQWYRRNPGKLVELAVVFPSDTRMTSEERTGMAQLIKHWEGVRIASATVILASGMLGAMHRSVLTGMTMLVPPPHPARVFAQIADAMSWLLPHLRVACGADVMPGSALSAVEGLCAAFQARTTRAGAVQA